MSEPGFGGFKDYEDMDNDMLNKQRVAAGLVTLLRKEKACPDEESGGRG